MMLPVFTVDIQSDLVSVEQSGKQTELNWDKGKQH